MSVENLQFLTTNQTLADLANFIEFVKNNRSELNDAQVFLAGFGYGGNLAIWFQNENPDLVNGVWSSGGALMAQLGFHGNERKIEYFQ